MFENIMNFFKKLSKKEKTKDSSNAAKERLHLVLMQDRANVSADFLELMRQEIIEVIKKYIDIDEKAIDVKLTNKTNEDGTVGAPALYANIPIVTIKNEARKVTVEKEDKTQKETNDSTQQEVTSKEEENASNKEQENAKGNKEPNNTQEKEQKEKQEDSKIQNKEQIKAKENNQTTVEEQRKEETANEEKQKETIKKEQEHTEKQAKEEAK